jgi:hypothetical protein
MPWLGAEAAAPRLPPAGERASSARAIVLNGRAFLRYAASGTSTGGAAAPISSVQRDLELTREEVLEVLVGGAGFEPATFRL